MRNPTKFICAAVLAAVLLTACGWVPQPFRGTPKVTSDDPLLDVPAATGVALPPIVGLPRETSDAFTASIADQLQAMEIPAAAVARAGSLGFIVTGHVAAVNESAMGQAFDV